MEIENGDDLHVAALRLNVDIKAPLTPAERAVIAWQSGMGGDFFTALWKAIVRADSGNLVNLYRAFPDHILGYVAYAHTPGWWQRVQCKLDYKGR